MIKVGRYTAGLLIVIIGGSSLLEQAAGGDYLSWLGTWWPVFLIMLGLEYLYVVNRYKGEERPLKLDLTGLLIGIVLAVIMVGSLKIPLVIDAIKHSEIGDALPANWFREDRDAAGGSIALQPAIIPFDRDVKRVKLHNVYGGITIRAEDRTDVSVQAAVWGDTSIQDAGSMFQHERSGNMLTISELPKREGGPFGNGNRRVDLTVIIPSGREVDYEVDVTSGTIEAIGLNGGFTLKTINGSIQTSDLTGDVRTETVNGTIKAHGIKGDFEADTKNGSIDVVRVTGQVKAESAVSSISIESDTIGGDWDISNAVGSVILKLPENASFNLKGRAIGRITSEFPIQTDHMEFNGENGAGEHDIRVETHGSFSFFRVN